MPRFIRTGGVVSLKLSPPLEFIGAQTGRFRHALDDFSGLWARFAKSMTEIELERFATEGHGDWPPLAPATLIEKEREGFPPFPLIRTGELYQSLTDAARAARMDPRTMSWGTDVPYAKFHQGYRDDAGAPTDPGRPPVRKVLDLTVGDRRRLERDMVSWLNDVARQAFGAAA